MANGFLWTFLDTLSASFFRSRRNRLGDLRDLNANQLADIGIKRDDDRHTYRRVREPALLEVLFPREEAPKGGQNEKALPRHPRHGPTRRREKQEA